MKDIAKEAGVSTAAVSYILNDSPDKVFTQKIRDRVRQAAKRLDYLPNNLFAGVRNGRSKSVGVLMPAGQFYGEILQGLHDALNEADYVPILAWNREDMATQGGAIELRHIHRLLEHRVDGVVMRPTRDEADMVYFQEIGERSIPLVVVDRELSGVRCDFVGTDDEVGGRLAAQHLLELGHRSVAHLGGPMTVSTSRDRRRGFEAAMAASGSEVSWTSLEAPRFGKVTEIAEKLLKSDPRPTAVFAANDDSAWSVYEAAARLGLSIPKDLSVIGFGDLVFANYLTPSLTTIRQPTHEIGRTAAQLLLKHMTKKSKNPEFQKVRLAPSLVIRKSTGSVK